MKQTNKSKAAENHYKIQDSRIIDTKKRIRNGEQIHIREILDSASSEYKSSTISKKDRLDIIGSIGLVKLTKMLDDCFNNKDGYNAQNETAFAIMDLMNGAYPELGFCLVKNNSNLELVLQLVSPTCRYRGLSLPHEHLPLP